MDTSKDCEVVVCGYYGFGSLGDEAVLDAVLDALKKSVPPEKITVISSHTGRHGSVRCVGRTDAAAIVSSLAHCSLLVCGGGSLLQDTTSRRSLLYYTSVIRLAKLFGCKIYIFANGVGPLNHSLSASKALRCADRITLRDPDSLKKAVSLGADPEITSLYADPVFQVQPETNENAGLFLSRLGIPENRHFFAVSLRKCGGKHIDKTAVSAAFRRLSACGRVPLFIPMQSGYDREICEEVCAGCGGIVAEIPDAQMLCGVLSRADFAVGMRLHFLLCAAVAGVSFAALSYDCKVDSCVKYIGRGTVIDAFTADYKSILAACCKAAADRDAPGYLKARSGTLSALAREDLRMLSDIAALCADRKHCTEKTAAMPGKAALQ